MIYRVGNGKMLASTVHPWSAWLNWMFAAATLPLLLVGAFYPRGLRGPKLVFNLRFLLFPLGIVSPLAMAGFSAMHGVEYVLISMQMAENSNTHQAGLLKWSMPVLGLALAVPFALFTAKSESGFVFSWPAWAAPITTSLLFINFVTGYLHYYVDRNLFRFKDPEIRSKIGPLLMSPRGERSADAASTRAA